MEVGHLLDGPGQQLAVERAVNKEAPHHVVHPRAQAHPVHGGRVFVGVQLRMVLNDGRRERATEVHGVGELQAWRLGTAIRLGFEPRGARWY